jgi:hypothetical protein
MNTETDKTSFPAEGHPDENQLLLALERELSPEETVQVEQHLGNCWSCRARSNEMQNGILAFVEYREKRYLPALDTPPRHFRGFPGELKRIAHESKPLGLSIRIWRGIRRFLTASNQLKWVSATAAIMVLVIFWTQVLFNPSTVSASEFLTRATAAQNPASPEKGNVVRTAHQRVRISSGQVTVVREFEWTVGNSIPEARWPMKTEPSEWNVPLTADGFAGWRDSISTKTDKVSHSGDRLTLDTAAMDPRVKEAWLVVRASDFHPVEQHIRFADDHRLDFEELGFEISAPQKRASESISQARIAPRPQARVPEVAPEPPVDANETELELRYAMFTRLWDLDEDLSITRVQNGVAVSGTASSAERAASMQALLSGLPNVQLSIAAPGDIGRAAIPDRSATLPSASTSFAPLLRDALDKAFTSQEQRREFVEGCLAASDTTLSHAWALKKLVDRYSASEQLLLKAESITKLKEMFRVHLQRLAEANAGLDPLIELLPNSRTQHSALPGSWRANILALFANVKQQDSLVARLVAGTQPDGRDPVAAFETFRSTHEAIGALLGGLNNLEVGEDRR